MASNPSGSTASDSLVVSSILQAGETPAGEGHWKFVDAKVSGRSPHSVWSTPAFREFSGESTSIDQFLVTAFVSAHRRSSRELELTNRVRELEARVAALEGSLRVQDNVSMPEAKTMIAELLQGSEQAVYASEIAEQLGIAYSTTLEALAELRSEGRVE